MAAGAAAKVDDEEDGVVAEGEPGEEPSRKKWSGKRLVLVGGIPLLLILIGAGLYFSGVLSSSKKVQAPVAKVAPGPAIYVDLPDILVNLEATGRQQRFLKASISLQVASQADADALKKELPRLMDQFQTYLRGLRVDDLHGSAGVYRLRQELLARVAQAAEPTPVDDVLFRELLVQ